MKKVKYLFFIILLLPIVANAAGTATISAPASIDNGSSATVSVTIKNTAAWNILISGSGNTPGCTTKVADVTIDGNNATKTFNLTCDSNGIGSITFTATGDITSADGVKSYVNLSKTVTVNKPREKESESRLSTLSIEGYSINFSKDKKEYSIVIEPNVDKIKIEARAISKYASITGTGLKKIEAEENKFIISCKSETGSKTDYIINVSVKDGKPIKAIIDGKEYTVLKSNKLLTAPTNYVESTVKINNFNVTAYTSEVTKLTIVGLKDINGNIKYAIYDNGNYKLYNENKSNSILLYITESNLDGYEKTTIKIGNDEYQAYKIDKRYSIVYGMNILTGEYGFYTYDNVENTFQSLNNINSNDKTNSFNIFILTTIIFAITTMLLIVYSIYEKNKKYAKNKKKVEESNIMVSTNICKVCGVANDINNEKCYECGEKLN